MANRFLNNITINDQYTFPSTDGSAGQAIVTDGLGNLTFGSAVASSATSSESVHITVKNTSGATITKGTPVYVTGETGNSGKIEVAPADASDVAKMPALGLLESDLANNGEGFCAQGGLLEGLATATIDGTSTTANDTVYVKAGGGLTMTKPTGTNFIQNIAKVARVHASNGSLVVSSILRTNDVPTPLYIDHAAQRVGIGDAFGNGDTIETNLHIKDVGPQLTLETTTAANAILNLASTSRQYRLFTDGSTFNIVDETQAVPRIKIDALGKIGISRSVPSEQLDVNGNIKMTETAASSDTDKFVVLDSGVLKYRTGAEIRSDIDAVGGSGTGGTIALFTSSGTDLGDSIITQTSQPNKITIGGELSLQGSGDVLNISHYSGSVWYIDTSTGDDILFGAPAANTQNVGVQGDLYAYNGDLGTKSAGSFNNKISRTSNSYFNAGNVGIGTTSPAHKLTINGTDQYVATQHTSFPWDGSVTIGLKMGTDNAAGLLDFRRWTGSATLHGTALITQVSSDGGYGLDFRVDNKSTNTSATTSRMFLSTSGEVGIGTTSPGAKLQVAGNGAFNSSLIVQDPDAPTNGNLALLHDSGGSTIYSNPASGNVSTVVLKLGINNSEKMRIANNGNVGIGTTSPSEKLHVAGNMRLQNQLYDSTNSQGTFNDVLTKVSAGTEWKSISDLPIDSRYVAVTGDTMTGNLTIGDGSADNYVRSYFSDGTYAEMRGYGMQFSRGASYLRPTSDKNLALNVGNDGQTWNQVRLNTNEFTIERDADTFVKVNSAGNVGIGITSPLCRLHIGKALNTGSTTEEFRIQTATGSGFGGNAVVNLVTGTYGTSGVYFGANSTYSSQPGKIEYADSSGTLSYNALTHYWRSNNDIKMTLLSSGNFGIGTTNPTAKLHVSSGAADEDCVVIIESDTDNNDETSNPRLELKQDGGAVIGRLGFRDNTNSLELINQYAESLYLGTSNSTDLTILSNGNVGIGTTGPTSQLSNTNVNSTDQAGIGHSSTAIAWRSNNQGYTATFDNYLDSTISNGLLVKTANTGTASYISKFESGGINRMSIRSDGNVGIGTTSPQAKLHVANGTLRTWTPIAGTSAIFESTESNRSFITITGANESELWFGDATTQAKGRVRYENNNNIMEFWTNANPRMYISQDGNIGIGNPAVSKLHVFNNDTQTSTGVGLTVEQDGTGDAVVQYLLTNIKRWVTGIDNSDGDKFKISQDADLGTNNVMTFDTAGKVGIGTTSPNAGVDIAKTTRITGDANIPGSGAGIEINYSTQGEIYAYDRTASAYKVLRLRGSSILLNQGNVGINTANPSQKLEVAGNIYAKDTNYCEMGVDQTDSAAIRMGVSSGGVNTFIDASNTGAGHAAGTPNIRLLFNASEKFRFTGGGNFGIGTTSPQEKLHVQNQTTGESHQAMFKGGAVTVGDYSYISLNNGYSTEYNKEVRLAAVAELSTSNKTGFAILTSPDSNGASGHERLRVTADGNVGIGTTSPAEKLSVATGTDASGEFGQTHIGFVGYSGYAGFSHIDRNSAGNYALLQHSNGLTYLNGSAGQGIRFRVNNADHMILNGSGNIGIGTTNPGKLLELSGGANVAAIRLRDTGSNVWDIQNSTLGKLDFIRGGTNTYMRIDQFGNVGINDTTPSYKLDVNGTIRATGDVIAYSDIRVKENIRTIENALDKVKKLRGVEYNKIDNPERSIGVIAQEIEDVLPEVVKEDNEGMKSVAYGNITAVLIEAIKEQQKQIDELKSIINASSK